MNADTLNSLSGTQFSALARRGEDGLARRSDPALLVVARPSQVVPPAAGPVVTGPIGRPGDSASLRPFVKRVIRVAAVAAVLVVAWRIGVTSRTASHQAAAAGAVETPVSTVTVERPQRATGSDVVLPATIHARQTTSLV